MVQHPAAPGAAWRGPCPPHLLAQLQEVTIVCLVGV